MVFIAVTRMSNALNGVVEADISLLVISCLPYSEKFFGMDILSTLRMLSGVAPMTILNPKSTTLAAVKIFALNDSKLKKQVVDY